MPAAVHLDHVRHAYGDRQAIADLSFDVEPGEAFVLLGPNGSGKTTLFRLLSTLMPLQEGNVEIFGENLVAQAAAVRSSIGVVFQAPSLDKKLTVTENLACHGRMYGLGSLELKRRIEEMLQRLGITDRAKDIVETLSGGLRRRVELAKGLLHQPRLLLLDEPSTGLDPGARSDLWKYLRQVQEAEGVTLLATTHLLEEAERADRIAIMHQGKLVALDTPAALQSSIGGDAITIRTTQPQELAAQIGEQFSCEATVLDDAVRLEQADGASWAPRLFEAFGNQITALTIGKPTLEDVFIDRTGHRFFGDEPTDEPKKKKRGRKH